MAISPFMTDPATRALVALLRADGARAAALEVLSGLARHEAERRQLSQAVARCRPATYAAGARLYATLAALRPPTEPTDAQAAVACARCLPDLPPLAARHGLPLRLAVPLVLALASCPPPPRPQPDAAGESPGRS